jgi:hypothetical protein
MKNVFLLLAAWLLGLCAVDAHEQGLTKSDVQKSSYLSETRGEEANPMDSLYGEWWLVGWNDNGTWYEVNKKYVCHQQLSLEINEEGYMTVYSMVNIITFGQVTLDGNEMHFDVEKVITTQVCCDAWENNFFEKHLIYIKSYQLDGNLLRLYYTDNDYFVFTKDYNDIEEQNDYIPFVELGKLWHVVNNPTNPNVPCRIQRFKMNHEVERDGKTYVNLEPFDDIVPDTIFPEAGLFREENRRVYKYEGGRDVMLYDFSLKEGDTFTYEYETGLTVNCKVLKQGWLEDGPEIMTYADEYRKLRTWTIGIDNGSGEYIEAVTWIEGIGKLRNMFYRPDHIGIMSCLAYVERDMNKVDFSKNAYLPFSFYNMYGPVYGCNLPKGAEDNMEEAYCHQLNYEQERDCLHVYGKVILNCASKNHYAYFIEESTEDPLVRKLHLQIEYVGSGELATCVSLFNTDFYVSGLNPNINYIIVDNIGEEHPVINKTPQDEYRPFVEEGKVWQVGDHSGNPVQRVEYYYFEGDTIIDGRTCKQMMCQRYVAPDHPDYAIISQLPSLSYVGAWYEEDKKVYFCDAEDNQFKLMYDFSINANDTLWVNNNYPPYIVGPRQTGGINGFKGVYRDVMRSGEGENSYNTTWLEGVGNIDGPIYSVYYGKERHVLFLMACAVGDELIYFNDEYEDGATPAGARKQRFDFTHTIKEKPKTRMRGEEEQSLYGEYNEHQLNINLNPINDAYMVSITDESGNAVYEKAINAGSIVGLNIDISKYPEGNYTVTVENSNESFTGEFKAQLTGIEEVRSKKIEAKGHIYNLQGQRLSRLQKGLNIVNGQKIYVKN